MKKNIFMIMLLVFATTLVTAQNKQNSKNEQKMDRIELSQKKFKELFGDSTASNPELDPELMGILRKFIFGEVFYVGNLNDTIRELITIVSLTTQQTLPQLKAHTNAALNIGVSPVAIKEAVYQCAPFIGFPKVLNALNEINQVFTARNIKLPLESQGTVKEEDRYAKGLAIQDPIYGNEIKEKMKDLPGGMGEDVPRFLTELCFGDFYTRNGLDIKTRELLVLCVLTTLGAEKQIYAHALGNVKVGNSKETMIAAMIHCLPYIGFPNTLNAINIIKSI
jgi:4-carboxymuconolactone decarboxylase